MRPTTVEAEDLVERAGTDAVAPSASDKAGRGPASCRRKAITAAPAILVAATAFTGLVHTSHWSLSWSP